MKLPMSSPVNFLIVHGTHGNPQGNWFPWLTTALHKYGKVFSPVFPTPDGQSLKTWLEVAAKTLAGIGLGNTILIGHSSGAILVLRMAERTKHPYRAVFSICPFERDLGLPDYDPLNTSFVHPEFNWQAVKHGAKKITCFAGDDDPYVPFAATKAVADQSGAELITVKKGGHLNAESGYSKFPLLLEKITQELST
jgi:uncharacterized protein